MFGEVWTILAFTELNSYVDVTISDTLFTELFRGTASFMSGNYTSILFLAVSEWLTILPFTQYVAFQVMTCKSLNFIRDRNY